MDGFSYMFKKFALKFKLWGDVLQPKLRRREAEAFFKGLAKMSGVLESTFVANLVDVQVGAHQ